MLQWITVLDSVASTNCYLAHQTWSRLRQGWNFFFIFQACFFSGKESGRNVGGNEKIHGFQRMNVNFSPLGFRPIGFQLSFWASFWHHFSHWACRLSLSDSFRDRMVEPPWQLPSPRNILRIPKKAPGRWGERIQHQNSLKLGKRANSLVVSWVNTEGIWEFPFWIPEFSETNIWCRNEPFYGLRLVLQNLAKNSPLSWTKCVCATWFQWSLAKSEANCQ